MGASYAEGDETITHQVVDRPVQSHTYLSRFVSSSRFYDDVDSALGATFNLSGFLIV